jgi:glycolate oxidase FAD binding subunit
LVTETLLTQLTKIVSPEAVTTESPKVDGIQAGLAVTPDSVAGLAAVIAELHAAESPLVLLGGGTMLDVGNPPTAADVAVCTGNLNDVTGYEPADLIITAEAGVTIAALQHTLAAHDQMLPLEVPCYERATVGGAIAANASGPLRFAFGTAKDLVMGMQFVQGDGTLVKSGGEVVKNVAGFSLHKLQVGAFGTLGAIAAATFKVYPLPKADETMLFAFESSAAAFAAAYAIRAHDPAAAAVLNEAAQQRLFGAIHSHSVLIARFLGVPRAVERQVREAKHTGSEAGAVSIEVVGETDGKSLWQQCVDLCWEEAAPEMLFRASAVPSESHHVYVDVERAAMQSEAETLLVADPLNGLLKCGVRIAPQTGQISADENPPDAALLGLLQRTRAVSQEHGGSLLLQRGPTAMKSAFDVWGPEPEGLNVMGSLKQIYDPHRILNRGRFVGDI